MKNRRETHSRLVGGDELFFEESVLRFYNKVINKWKNPGRPIALLLGCSNHKPYSTSFMHRKVIAMLENLRIDHLIQQYIVGEPLTICPREMENEYPAAHYDFPPESLSTQGRETLIHRLSSFFCDNRASHCHFVVFAPRHHLQIIEQAAGESIELKYIPYNVYKLPELKETLLELVR